MAPPDLPDDRRVARRRRAPVDDPEFGSSQGPMSSGRHAAGPTPGSGAPPPPANGRRRGRQPPYVPPGGRVPPGQVPPGPRPGQPGRVPPPQPGPPANGRPVNGRRVNGGPVKGAPLRRPDPADDEPTVAYGALLDDGGARRADAAPPEAPGRHRRRAGESPDERPAADYREKAASGRRKARSGRRRRGSFWKELPLLIVVALLLTFLIQTFLAKVYVIPSGSMEATLHGCNGCNNDRVLVDKITYRFTDPAPGDVVVFRGPDSWGTEIELPEPPNAFIAGLQQFGSLIGLAPPDEKDFVKRVIAVGGQTVSCCDPRNRVMVDGQPLNESYVYFLPETGLTQETFGPITVPEGQLWMMGDSRNNSADSREPDHGPVPVENVIGKARLIVLPFDRFGTINSPNPHVTAVGMDEGTAGSGAPLALGLLGTLPLAAVRRRQFRRDTELHEFLPPPRRWRRGH